VQLAQDSIQIAQIVLIGRQLLQCSQSHLIGKRFIQFAWFRRTTATRTAGVRSVHYHAFVTCIRALRAFTVLRIVMQPSSKLQDSAYGQIIP